MGLVDNFVHYLFCSRHLCLQAHLIKQSAGYSPGFFHIYPSVSSPHVQRTECIATVVFLVPPWVLCPCMNMILIWQPSLADPVSFILVCVPRDPNWAIREQTGSQWMFFFGSPMFYFLTLTHRSNAPQLWGLCEIIFIPPYPEVGENFHQSARGWCRTADSIFARLSSEVSCRGTECKKLLEKKDPVYNPR